MSYLSSHTIALPLRKGDEVITAGVSSALTDNQLLNEGLELITSWGLICRPNNLLGRRWGYLAGKDDLRQKDLSPNNPAPLMTFARGGWGAARLLENKQNWKKGWLLGFSDITSILLARLKAGFDGNVHGPLLTTLSKEPKWSQSRLKSLLFGRPLPNLKGDSWKIGIATGPLVVANLTVASHLLGTPFMPDLRGAILIFEDIGEAPYRIDRMLTQWRLTGILHQLAGIAFGSFQNCINTEDSHPDETFQLNQILKERTQDLGIPVVGNLPIGHCCGNAALPLGREACLNGNRGELSVSP